MKSFKKEIIVGSIALFLFVLITLFVFVFNPVNFDTAVFNTVASIRSDFMTTVFNIITTLANKYFTVIFVVLTIIFLQNKNKSNYVVITKIEKSNNVLNRFMPWLIYGISVVVISVLFIVIKAIFQRIRPEDWFIVIETGYSFPSGHTATATILYGVLNLLILNSTNKKWLRTLSWGISSILILLVGLSRIYLGVHYATDVLGGLFLGIFVLCICNILIKKLNAKIDYTRKKQSENNI